MVTALPVIFNVADCISNVPLPLILFPPIVPVPLVILNFLPSAITNDPLPVIPPEELSSPLCIFTVPLLVNGAPNISSSC